MKNPKFLNLSCLPPPPQSLFMGKHSLKKHAVSFKSKIHHEINPKAICSRNLEAQGTGRVTRPMAWGWVRRKEEGRGWHLQPVGTAKTCAEMAAKMGEECWVHLCLVEKSNPAWLGQGSKGWKQPRGTTECQNGLGWKGP